MYETRGDMERIAPGAVDTNAFSNMVTRIQKSTMRLVQAGKQTVVKYAWDVLNAFLRRLPRVD